MNVLGPAITSADMVERGAALSFSCRVAASDADAQGLMAALCDLVRATVGARLFTMMWFDAEAGLARRCFSSMPDAYPVSGTKPVQDNDWTRRVLRQGQMAVMNSHAELAEHFPDADLIRSLGCESCLNVPVAVMGRTLGTLNCLHRAGHYTPARVAAAEQLKLPGAIAFMAGIFDRPEFWPRPGWDQSSVSSVV